MPFPEARTPVGRLAPSPTGALHLGHARTFLAAWLHARGRIGRVVLRIEDIDASRVRPGMAELALTDLRWLGLDWDEGPDVGGPSGPYAQSERLGRFDDALQRLKDLELVYPCTCTRAEVARAASAPHLGEEGPVYPGTCAGRSAGDAQTLGDRRYCWRFRAEGRPITWPDLIKGSITLDSRTIGGDFIVGRSDGAPSYQLAVVVDDAAMGVTEVIRGDDLITSTPRQLLLDRALGLAPPAFGHLPLVVGPDGRRLAKRDESIKLATLRDHGRDPRVLIGRLAHSIGLGAGGPSHPADWIGRLDPSAIIDRPFAVDSAAWLAIGGG